MDETGADLPDDRNGFGRNKGRQAVVLVHGMGEQQPLGTLREFVETVYQRDPELTKRNATTRIKVGDEELNRVWIVPDETTGSAELRRITTPENEAGYRTDFFEFYWADIMDGTPWEAVVAWFQGLLLRPWGRVPRRLPVILAWIMLWLITLLVLTTLIFIGMPETPDWITAITAKWGEWFAANRPIVAISAAILSAVAFGVAYLKANSLLHMKPGVPLFLLAVAIIAIYLPASVVGNAKIWLGAVAAFFTFVSQKLLTPYLGDVVRYVRATPSTVQKRKEIRDRGVELLTRVHNRKDEKDAPYYDRVILVAHSLGTIIAYDILQHFWEKTGPNHKRITQLDPATARSALKVDAFVDRTWPAGSNELGGADAFDMVEYAKAQGELLDRLAERGIWRVSDFITMGSPLVHAEFLMADSADQLKKAFEERLFSSSPPRPDRPKKTMVYWTDKRGPFIHFAGVFSAVRWTNIFDYHPLPLNGDLVSGPLRPIYGPGIFEPGPDGAQSDTGIPMIRKSWPDMFKRVFTHTCYWEWHESYQPGEPPPHIAALRKALDFKREWRNGRKYVLRESPVISRGDDVSPVVPDLISPHISSAVGAVTGSSPRAPAPGSAGGRGRRKAATGKSGPAKRAVPLGPVAVPPESAAAAVRAAEEQGPSLKRAAYLREMQKYIQETNDKKTPRD